VTRGILLILAGATVLLIFQPLYSQFGHPLEVAWELCALAVGWGAVAFGIYKLIILATKQRASP
jgi:hypothetical protein